MNSPYTLRWIDAPSWSFHFYAEDDGFAISHAEGMVAMTPMFGDVMLFKHSRTPVAKFVAKRVINVQVYPKKRAKK